MIGKVKHNKLNKKKGFTLMELMVVIAIMGILGVIVIPNLIKNIEITKGKTDKANAAVIASAAMTAWSVKEFELPDASATNAITAGDFEEYLNGGQVPTPLVKDKKSFSVKIDASGNISVFYDEESGEQLFP